MDISEAFVAQGRGSQQARGPIWLKWLSLTWLRHHRRIAVFGWKASGFDANSSNQNHHIASIIKFCARKVLWERRWWWKTRSLSSTPYASVWRKSAFVYDHPEVIESKKLLSCGEMVPPLQQNYIISCKMLIKSAHQMPSSCAFLEAGLVRLDYPATWPSPWQELSFVKRSAWGFGSGNFSRSFAFLCYSFLKVASSTTNPNELSILALFILLWQELIGLMEKGPAAEHFRLHVGWDLWVFMLLTMPLYFPLWAVFPWKQLQVGPTRPREDVLAMHLHDFWRVHWWGFHW